MVDQMVKMYASKDLTRSYFLVVKLIVRLCAFKNYLSSYK